MLLIITSFLSKPFIYITVLPIDLLIKEKLDVKFYFYVIMIRFMHINSKITGRI